jgi:hypothetical protein
MAGPLRMQAAGRRHRPPARRSPVAGPCPAAWSPSRRSPVVPMSLNTGTRPSRDPTLRGPGSRRPDPGDPGNPGPGREAPQACARPARPRWWIVPRPGHPALRRPSSLRIPGAPPDPAVEPVTACDPPDAGRAADAPAPRSSDGGIAGLRAAGVPPGRFVLVSRAERAPGAATAPRGGELLATDVDGRCRFRPDAVRPDHPGQGHPRRRPTRSPSAHVLPLPLNLPTAKAVGFWA